MKGWKEAEEKTIKLLDEEPAIFQAYLESVYNPSVNLLDVAISCADDLVHDDEDTYSECKPPVLAKTGHGLVKLYRLGDFLDDVLFKNKALESLKDCCAKCDFCLYTQAMRITFQETPDGCDLQNFVANAMVPELTNVEAVDWLYQISPTCLYAVTRARASKYVAR